jgi:predicted AlkP superfamily phosphohydrolase/phosphomutase
MKRLIEETRPDLSLIVFPEIHTAGHHLWHTIEPRHPFYTDGRFRRPDGHGPGLPEILREVDRQITGLVEAVGPGVAVFVFALHGMRPTRGIPTLLEPLLCGAGFSRRSDWSTRSWPDLGRTLFAAVKRRMPRGLKQRYYRLMSRDVTQRLARITILPAYDWGRTRAFSLPTDQHGWIRLNLAGREKEGIVPRAQYEDTCRQLGDLLRALRAGGRPVVRDVVQLARESDGVPPERLPDLIVHWDEAAFDDPVRLEHYPVQTSPTGLKFTGQHAPDGFCLTSGGSRRAGTGSTVTVEDLHRWMTAALGL